MYKWSHKNSRDILKIVFYSLFRDMQNLLQLQRIILSFFIKGVQIIHQYHVEEFFIQLTKMNITPLVVLGVKWPFSKGRGG